MLTESSFSSIPLQKKLCLIGREVRLHSRGHGLRGLRDQGVKMGESGSKRQACLDAYTICKGTHSSHGREKKVENTSSVSLQFIF